MRKLTFVLAFSTAVLSSIGAVAVSSAQAQGYYDDDGYRHRPHRYDGDERYDRCRALIRATGVGYPFGIMSRNSAIKAWRRETQAVYGRDFSWAGARGQSIECEPY